MGSTPLSSILVRPGLPDALNKSPLTAGVFYGRLLNRTVNFSIRESVLSFSNTNATRKKGNSLRIKSISVTIFMQFHVISFVKVKPACHPVNATQLNHVVTTKRRIVGWIIIIPRTTE